MPVAKEPTKLDLTKLTNKSEYIVKIQEALEKAVGQKIVIVMLFPIKRVAGVSCVPVDFNFLGGQKLTLFIRAGADAFKAKLNDKELVLGGDFSNDLKDTFDRAVKTTATAIRNNQKKFEKAQQKTKATPPKSQKDPTKEPKLPPLKQLNVLKEKDDALTQEIEKKQKTVEELEAEIASL